MRTKARIQLPKIIKFMWNWRLSSWEIRQLVLAEIAECDWKVFPFEGGTCDIVRNMSRPFIVETESEQVNNRIFHAAIEAVDVYGYVKYLSFFHFKRGIIHAMKRNSLMSIRLELMLDAALSVDPIFLSERSKINQRALFQHETDLRNLFKLY